MSTIAVSVRDNRSLVGVSAGSVIIRSGDGGPERPLEEGIAIAGMTQSFQWDREAKWEPRGTSQRLLRDKAAKAWSFSATLTWQDMTDAVVLRGEDEGAESVRIEPGAVLLIGTDGTPDVADMGGAWT